MTTTTTTRKATPTASATRKATKSERKETTNTMTLAESRKLESLVTIVKTQVAEFTAQDSLKDAAALASGNARVFACRAIARLSEHPATHSTSNNSKGQPANLKIATLTGIPEGTLAPLFKSAMALKKAGLADRTGAPNQQERDIASKGHKTEAERKAQARAEKARAEKSKGADKGGSEGGSVDADSARIVKAVAALEALVGKFTADQGFDPRVGADLETRLHALADKVFESTPAKADEVPAVA